MGCFSWLCSKCGKGIESSSFEGHQCRLYYLKDGKVIEQLKGEYNSYGGVFIPGTQDPDVKHKLRKSQHFKTDWGIICDDVTYDDKPTNSGIAALHEECYSGEESIPLEASLHDPNQGWGEPSEEDEEKKDC